MTTPTWTPRPQISAMSRATCIVTPGSMPNCCSPMRASPDSFSRIRLYRADIRWIILGCWGIAKFGKSPNYQITHLPNSLGRFTDLHPRESANRDVLAEDADGGLHPLRHGDVGDAHPRVLD